MWTYDALWQKAKLYARRAFAEDRDSPTFPLWATLALEFLGRATLAKIHPVLVADPREPEWIMYAFGYRTSKPPRSIPAKGVFARCEVVAPLFTEAERKFCMAMVERRNEELHSGAPAFHDYPHGAWLAEYFRVCDILLDAQGRKLGHLFGGDEAKAARKMIAADQTELRSRVFGAIRTRREEWENRPEEDRRRISSAAAARSHQFTRAAPLTKLLRCPACDTPGILKGQRVRGSDPVAEEDVVVVNAVLLPTELECSACGLRLRTHGELHAAGLGAQYTMRLELDPADYYGLTYGQDDFYGEEYDNE